jgi:hypothetical protein
MTFHSNRVKTDQTANWKFTGRWPSRMSSTKQILPGAMSTLVQNMEHRSRTPRRARLCSRWKILSRGPQTKPARRSRASQLWIARISPGLRTAVVDAIWPIAVEDEHCEMPPPKPSLGDHQGTICTGNPIEVTPIDQPPQRFGIDHPGPAEVTAPSADRVRIELRLNLVEADSDRSDVPAQK